MRGAMVIDVGALSRRYVRNCIQELGVLFDVEVKVEEIKWLLESRFYVTFDGEGVYRAYEALKRACEEA